MSFVTSPGGVSKVRLTHIGTATVLLEIGALRLLTDPALDPAKQVLLRLRHRQHQDLRPVLPPGGLGQLDAVLLTHHQHADNFDDAGRAVTAEAATVIAAAARTLPRAIGLSPWQRASSAPVTCASASPPLRRATARRSAGPSSARSSASCSSGPVSSTARCTSRVTRSGSRRGRGRSPRQDGTALLHMGGVRFGISGPLRYTFDAAEAIRAAQAMTPAAPLIPIHYDGWTHFRQPRTDAEQAFAAANLFGRTG